MPEVVDTTAFFYEIPDMVQVLEIIHDAGGAVLVAVLLDEAKVSVKDTVKFVKQLSTDILGNVAVYYAPKKELIKLEKRLKTAGRYGSH